MRKSCNEFDHATASAGLALRRWLAQPQLRAAPGWLDPGPFGRSPLRSRLAGARLGRMLPAPEQDIDTLCQWHPWLTRTLTEIEASLMRVAALALQRQVRCCVHGRQRQCMIDTFGVPLYQEVMQTQWLPAQLEALDRLCLPVPHWGQRQQVLAYGLRLAHELLRHCSPYLAHRLLLLFPADIALPPVSAEGWSDAAAGVLTPLLRPEPMHDDH